ncbi:sigma-70 family RNA polymerase sigma factor [Streptomyces radiopugnans]|nr:sigma-70 family RNA polymerase sigma factor [Streptomyces radiopugnans]
MTSAAENGGPGAPTGPGGAPAEPSDAELTAAVRRQTGGESALAELYRRHHSAALAYARTFVRDAHTAEDLASEAFTRTIQAVQSGRGPKEAWRPYLLGVVRHTAGEWASSARRTELSADFDRWFHELHGAQGADTQSAEERMIRLEDGSMVLRGFRSLPERWQAVLWHSVVEGEPAARTGMLLGVSPSGVASLTARAREGLREAFLSAHAESAGRSRECRRYGTLLGSAVRRPGRRMPRHLRRHLDDCAGCRRALTELTDLNQRLGAVLPVALLLWGAPAYLTARLAAGVAASGTGAVSPSGSSGSSASSATHEPVTAPPPATAASPWGATAAAVAAAAAVAGGLLLLPGGEESVRTAPAPAASTSSVAPVPTVPKPPSPAPEPPSASATPSPSGGSASPAPGTRAVRGAAVPDPAAEDRTRLRPASTGRCMEIPAGSAAAGAQAREAACDGGAHQQWNLLRPGGDGRVQLRNTGTGMCLANQGTQIDDAPVTQAVCDPSDTRQLWGLHAPEGAGEARFIQDGGTMYLGLDDWANAADGKPHTDKIATNHHYYGSPSFGFLYDGALFDGEFTDS